MRQRFKRRETPFPAGPTDPGTRSAEFVRLRLNRQFNTATVCAKRSAQRIMQIRAADGPNVIRRGPTAARYARSPRAGGRGCTWTLQCRRDALDASFEAGGSHSVAEGRVPKLPPRETGVQSLKLLPAWWCVVEVPAAFLEF